MAERGGSSGGPPGAHGGAEAGGYERFLQYVRTATDYERQALSAAQLRRFDLERMRRLLALLGEPQRAVAIAHIAGSKGKGTTAAMLGAILEAAGVRTGVYLSPHVVELGERIQIGGRPADPAMLGAAFAQLEPALAALAAEGAPPPTFFELVTAMALVVFRAAGVRAAVLEVGLGGRLDATNAVQAQLSAITAIEREHTQVLGDTIEQIAAEKAGIIKPGVPVVLGRLPAAALAVIREQAQALAAPVLAAPAALEGRVVALGPGGTLADLFTPRRRLERVRIAMVGEPMAGSAALAATMAELLAARAGLPPIPEEAIRAGLAHARLRGRFELVASEPALVVDVAHTPESVAAFGRTLRRVYPQDRFVVVLGLLADKDLGGIAREVAGWAAAAVAAPCASPRERAPAEIAAALAAQGLRAHAAPGVAEALETAAELCAPLGPRARIAVCGSVYLAGQVLRQAAAPGGR